MRINLPASPVNVLQNAPKRELRHRISGLSYGEGVRWGGFNGTPRATQSGAGAYPGHDATICPRPLKASPRLCSPLITGRCQVAGPYEPQAQRDSVPGSVLMYTRMYTCRVRAPSNRTALLCLVHQTCKANAFLTLALLHGAKSNRTRVGS